jgi:exodeoxyribonuclease-3
VIQLDFKDIRLINAYFPSGTSGDERQGFKYEWLKELDKWLQKVEEKIPN